MQDQQLILRILSERLMSAGALYWVEKLKDFPPNKIHMALMVEPYPSYILSGKKTIESRFSMKKISPWHRIATGDVIILKRSGGEIVGIFEASEVRFLQIENDDDLLEIKRQFNKQLCIEDDFWAQKKNSNYATLISISNLCTFSPFSLHIKNRQSWIDFCYPQLEFQEPREPRRRISTAVICIAGKAGAGKTTVANYLKEQYLCQRYSVSDFLKAELKRRGFTEMNRSDLQDLGEEYIRSGWDHFCHDFIDFVDWDKQNPLIIDGVRHTGFLRALSSWTYPVPVCCIYLSANGETIARNIQNRGSEIVDSSRLAEGDQLKLEHSADLVIEVNGKSIPEIGEEIAVFLSQRLPQYGKNDNNTLISDLSSYLDFFNELRGWKKFHNPRDLSLSISLEASELLEIFQWSGTGKNKLTQTQIEKISEELADVMIYCIDLANACNLDITKTIIDKVQKNRLKYPEK